MRKWSIWKCHPTFEPLLQPITNCPMCSLLREELAKRYYLTNREITSNFRTYGKEAKAVVKTTKEVQRTDARGCSRQMAKRRPPEHYFRRDPKACRNVAASCADGLPGNTEVCERSQIENCVETEETAPSILELPPEAECDAFEIYVCASNRPSRTARWRASELGFVGRRNAHASDQ